MKEAFVPELHYPVAPAPGSPEYRAAKFAARVELLATVLLAVATVLTAWSAFQSTKWSSIETSEYAAAKLVQIDSARASNQANSQTVIDTSSYVAWLQALSKEQGGAPTLPNGYQPVPGTFSGFLFDHLRPEFKTALRAWLAAGGLSDVTEYPTPFARPEYSLAMAGEADRLAVASAAHDAAAKAANNRGDDYVLLTVLFAAVLFFAGVSTKFEIARNRVAMLALGSITLVSASLILLSFPVAF